MQSEMFKENRIEHEKISVCDAQNGWLEKYSEETRKYYASKEKIRTLSLFSGAGGLDIGFHDAGFDIVESVEIEKAFSKTLVANSGEEGYLGQVQINCIDIRDYNCERDIDFIIGGPPCQTFSAAGRRANGVTGTTEDRGVLFLEYVRLLDKLKPVGFLFENVYGIIGAQNGAAWKQIVEEFSNIGYKLHFRILDAADYGVPQHRERLIIIGLREGSYYFPRPTHGSDSLTNTPHYSAEEALKNVVINGDSKGTLNGEHGHLLKDIPPGLNYSFYTERMNHPNPIFAWRSKFSDFLYKADNDRPIRTLKAQGGQYTGPFHWDSRPFDTNELKRLQTFPDEYSIIGGRGKIIHQIGNSVPPQLARILATTVKEQVFYQGSPVTFNYLQPSDELTFRKRKRLLSKVYAEKAKIAINRLYSENVSRVKKIAADEEVFCFTKDLTIMVSADGSYKGKVTSSEQETVLTIRKVQQKDERFNSLIIQPLGKWSVNSKKIELKWIGSSLLDYFVGWKFLEYQLRKNNIKSDLVQLAGYYQYKPSFIIVWDKDTLKNNQDYSKLNILSSNGLTREAIKLTELANSFNVSVDEAMLFLETIKSLGYDVRNKNTNSMIKEGEVLIPYEFPTLYNKSVQYNKRL